MSEYGALLATPRLGFGRDCRNHPRVAQIEELRMPLKLELTLSEDDLGYLDDALLAELVIQWRCRPE
jgi:hypothetical protein